ncbi:MMPL family transporter, partial [Candidatus Poribacteria bacterium]|nr:MMPL family transporter [Candidatus Poribacteria bacterium]
PEGDARAVALLTQEDWDALEEKLKPEEIERSMVRLRALLNSPIPRKQRDLLLQDPLNFYEIVQERLRLKTGPLKVNLRDNYFMSSDGQMLLMLVWPVRPSTDLAFAREFQDFLEQTRRGIFLRNPQWSLPDKPEGKDFTISFYGPHYEAISDSRLVGEDFRNTSIVSSIAVILLFVFAFRRPEALVFVSVPLTMGLIWTLGLASLLVGRLTQVTMAFAAILIGSGVDYSVHLYNRYLEETRLGRENREALRLAVIETGPGLIAGALTGAIAFFGMMLTSFVGFRELGLVTGLGILCCLLSVILVLPPLLAYLGRGPVGVFTQRPMSSFGLRRLHFLAMAYPRVTVMCGLIICGFLGYHAQNVQFEDDFRALRQPSDEYEALRQRLREHFEIPTNQVVAIVSGDSEQAALEANDALFHNIYLAEKALYPLTAKDSLRYFLPSGKTQQRQLERMSQKDIGTIKASLESIGARYKIAPRAFEPFISRLRQLQEAARTSLESGTVPVALGSIASSEGRPLGQLTQRYVYKTLDNEWRIVTQIYPPEGEWVSSVPQLFRETISQGINPPPQITGSAIIQQELRQLIVNDLAKTTLFVLIAVLIYLVIYFESVPRALLALMPVVVALICMLGVIDLFHMKLHYMNIISLPMIIGIGVDSGIHLLQRYYEQGKRDLRATVTRTGRAVVITTMTTIFGFGSLALANFRGIRDLGVFSIIGVGFTMIASLLLLPAILRLIEKGMLFRGGPGDDLG